MKKLRTALLAFGLAFVLAAPAGAGDFIKARALYLAKDYEEAFKEWMILAQEGDHRGQMFVGRMLMRGLGVQKNLNAAIPWFLRSARQGNGYSLDQMGVAHVTGRGAPQDIVTGNMYFKLANLRGFSVQNRIVAEENMTRAQILQSHIKMQQFIKKYDFSIPTLKKKKK